MARMITFSLFFLTVSKLLSITITFLVSLFRYLNPLYIDLLIKSYSLPKKPEIICCQGSSDDRALSINMESSSEKMEISYYWLIFLKKFANPDLFQSSHLFQKFTVSTCVPDKFRAKVFGWIRATSGSNFFGWRHREELFQTRILLMQPHACH